jgi:hypothetical protein
MEIALETLTKGGIGLNAATRAYPFRRDTWRETWIGKIILQWKKIMLVPKGNWLIAFTIGAMLFV